MRTKKDLRNELFKRQELVFEIDSDKTPSFNEVKKEISEKFSKPEENIDVLKIEGGFGKNVFLIEAYIYDSKEDLGKMVELRKTKKQRVEEKKPQEEGRLLEKDGDKKDSEEEEAEEEKEEKGDKKDTEEVKEEEKEEAGEEKEKEEKKE